jgi:hypothetical protein
VILTDEQGKVTCSITDGCNPNLIPFQLVFNDHDISGCTEDLIDHLLFLCVACGLYIEGNDCAFPSGVSVSFNDDRGTMFFQMA